MIQNGTRQLTAFETVLGALLDDGHTVTFKEKDGNIVVKINGGSQLTVFGSNLEQVGQIFIDTAVSDAWQHIAYTTDLDGTDQGGAGKTRIDGGD